MKKNHFLLIIVCSVFSFLAQAQNFMKVTNSPISSTLGDSRSVNWVDVNNDGWLDCQISNGPKGGQHNSLFINDKKGDFTKVENDPIVSDNAPSDGATWGDCDNDGDLDCFVVNWYGVNNLFYLNNGDGSFKQVLGENLANNGGYSETAAWGDYDNDGLLDLYVTNSDGDFRNFLYRNNGNNKFIKITNSPASTDAFASRNVSWVDMDNDGDLDLFVTNENSQNENIYRNDKGVFVKNTTSALVKDGKNTMSSAWADYDNDGDLDVFLCNDKGTNSLFRNDGNFVFTKNTTDTLAKTTANAFSAAWADVDNDGDLDLFVTNAFSNTNGLKNWFYLNNGNSTFQRVENILTKDLAWSYGCAFGDYDNDGFQDLAVATCRIGASDYADFLYHNEGNANHWLTIQLIGTQSNKSAIGSKIRAKAVINGKAFWQMREVSSQSAYCGQNDMRAHFGLGNATKIDSLVIEWSSGKKEVFTNLNSKQFLQIIENQGIVSDKPIMPNSEKISIYPNPAHDTLFIHTEDVEQNFQLLDINGKTVLEGKRLDKQLNISHLSNGVYFLNIGEKTFKVVKE